MENANSQNKKSRNRISESITLAVVEELLGRTGFRGEITQVKCLIRNGRDEGRSMRRNVRGPIRIGDVLVLRETEIEAKRIRSKLSKGAYT